MIVSIALGLRFDLAGFLAERGVVELVRMPGGELLRAGGVDLPGVLAQLGGGEWIQGDGFQIRREGEELIVQGPLAGLVGALGG